MRGLRTLTGRSLLAGAAAVTAVLLTSIVAWACTSLATLEPSPSSAGAGEKVRLAGENFDPAGSEVKIRFNSLQGQVLATATADKDGEISTTIRVPDVANGQYVLIATQTSENPEDGMAFGLPARAALIVGSEAAQAPATSADVRPQPVESIAPSQGAGAEGWILLAALGVVAVLLFVAGLVAFVAEVRRKEVGATVRGRP